MKSRKTRGLLPSADINDKLLQRTSSVKNTFMLIMQKSLTVNAAISLSQVQRRRGRMALTWLQIQLHRPSLNRLQSSSSSLWVHSLQCCLRTRRDPVLHGALSKLTQQQLFWRTVRVSVRLRQHQVTADRHRAADRAGTATSFRAPGKLSCGWTSPQLLHDVCTAAWTVLFQNTLLPSAWLTASPAHLLQNPLSRLFQELSSGVTKEAEHRRNTEQREKPHVDISQPRCHHMGWGKGERS